MEISSKKRAICVTFYDYTFCAAAASQTDMSNVAKGCSTATYKHCYSEPHVIVVKSKLSKREN